MPSSRPEARDEAACRKVALDLLARREHSRLELERKLAARDYPPDVTAAVLDRLEASGALAADRFAETFIRSRAARGQGPVRIRAELEQRGIDGGRAGELLREAGVDWYESARRVRAKRFGAALPRDAAGRARQARFLAQRGFAPEQIRAALETAADSD
ncbi:MAG TPA: regulatory protein RecX [Gammaproteobacteria bacterium]